MLQNIFLILRNDDRFEDGQNMQKERAVCTKSERDAVMHTTYGKVEITTLHFTHSQKLSSYVDARLED